MGMGGKGGSSQTTYKYTASVEMALCEGPVVGILNAWDSSGVLMILEGETQYTVPSGGGTATVNTPNGNAFLQDRGVTAAQAYSVATNDYGSDGADTLTGTQQVPVSTSAYTVTPSGASATYAFDSSQAGKIVNITFGYSPNSADGTPGETIGITVFQGTRPQSPWSYLTSTHPGQDLP